MAKKKTAKRVARTTKAKRGVKPKARPRKGKTHAQAYDVTARAMGTVTPYLAVGDARGAIEWYKKVFGAKLFGGQPMPGPDGRIMHAQLKIGDSLVFLSDIFPQSDLVDPTRAGASVNLNIFHKDCDRMWERAVANGAKVTMPIDDMFWGDRYGRIVDPFGHSWAITRKSKLSQKELDKKREATMAQMGAAPS